MRSVLGLFLFLVLGSFPALASENACQLAFENLVRKPYSQARLELETAIRTLDPQVQKGLTDLVDSVHFVDYQDQAPPILDSFNTGSSIVGKSLHRLYDEERKIPEDPRELAPGMLNKLKGLFGRGKYVDKPADPRMEFAGVFGNYQNASKQGLVFAKDPSLEQMKQVHAKAMAGGVGNLRERELIGEIRDTEVYGNAVAPAPGLTDEEVKAVQSSPYLSWEETSAGAPGVHHGKILYPTVKNAKPELLKDLESVYPDVVAEVRAFQAANTSGTMVVPQGLNRRLVSAMTDKLLRWLVKQREQLGDLDTTEKIDQYIELASKFQHDFVAIHPFRDGNGRTSRILLSSLLQDKNIPPPRLFDPNRDLLVSEAEWVKAVRQGIAATDRLYGDLTERIYLRLPLEKSPELVDPNIPRTVFVNFKVHSKDVVIENHREALTESRQFGAFVRQKMLDQPGLASSSKQVLKDMKTVEDEFIAFEKKNHMDFEHAKNGVEDISLNLVDEDFKAIFGRPLSRNAEAWNTKMGEWFQKEVVWRGLSYKTHDVTDEEITAMFKQIHGQMTSNEVARHSGGKTPDQIRELIIRDFDRYNRDLYQGKLSEMARDHSETGPKYGESYGYSTSKNRTVGKAFAMGAMVVAKYGEQLNPEAQALLKSRILIGAYRGKKDVDLGRLHQFDPDFKYKYGRQQEVMGIGASDPDSIMIVQKLNAEGKVDQSFVRNPQEPSKIWVVQGQWPPEAEDRGTTPEIAAPPADRLQRTITLW